MRRAALLAAVGMLATAASGDRAERERAAFDADLSKALAGRSPGKPVTCLTAQSADAPQVIGNRTLLFRDGRHIWRNDLPDACPGLDDDAIIVSEIYGGQQCRGDLFYTIRRGGGSIPGPRCRLGSFVPYDKPAKAR